MTPDISAIVRKAVKTLNPLNPKSWKQSFETAILEATASLRAQLEQRWIPVSEQPKRGQQCLVVALGNVQYSALVWAGEKFVWADTWEEDDTAFDEFPSEQVTHWMPLPAAPESPLNGKEGK